MAIKLNSEVSAVLGESADKCDSRSLFQSRFSGPDLKSEARNTWFVNLTKKESVLKPSNSIWLPENAVILYCQLMAKLIINSSGGTMENAHICLDRFGMPYIPGSAVKGCARTMSLQSLRVWVESIDDNSKSTELCGACFTQFTDPAEYLAKIAHVFGWAENDWLHDFNWAACEDLEILEKAKSLSITSQTFGGTIAFLDAYPNKDPGLEVDVLTVHHSEYYKGNNPIALDCEDTTPVAFPAVKNQKDSNYFSFPLIPLQRHLESDVEFAKLWLAQGLEILGIGAKTAAGYGWFDTSDDFQKIAEAKIAAGHQYQQELADSQEEKARKIAQDKQRREEKERIKEETKNLSPDGIADREIKQLSESQFDGKVRSFTKKKGGPSDLDKKAIVRALRDDRVAYWNDFKNKSTKGPLAAVQQEIRKINKELFGDKMP